MFGRAIHFSFVSVLVSALFFASISTVAVEVPAQQVAAGGSRSASG